MHPDIDDDYNNYEKLGVEKFYGISFNGLSKTAKLDCIIDYVHLFELLFRNIIHIGPLRKPPERGYTWEGSRPRNVGQRGESTDQALIWSRLKKSGDLFERIQYWMKKMDLTNEIKLQKVMKDFYQITLRTKQKKNVYVNLPDVGFGVSQVLPFIVQSFYADKGSKMEKPNLPRTRLRKNLH